MSFANIFFRSKTLNVVSLLHLQDYKTYLDFVLALENKKEPQALHYLFKILDVQVCANKSSRIIIGITSLLFYYVWEWKRDYTLIHYRRINVVLEVWTLKYWLVHVKKNYFRQQLNINIFPLSYFALTYIEIFFVFRTMGIWIRFQSISFFG